MKIINNKSNYLILESHSHSSVTSYHYIYDLALKLSLKNNVNIFLEGCPHIFFNSDKKNIGNSFSIASDGPGYLQSKIIKKMYKFSKIRLIWLDYNAVTDDDRNIDLYNKIITRMNLNEYNIIFVGFAHGSIDIRKKICPSEKIYGTYPLANYLKDKKIDFTEVYLMSSLKLELKDFKKYFFHDKTFDILPKDNFYIVDCNPFIIDIPICFTYRNWKSNEVFANEKNSILYRSIGSQKYNYLKQKYRELSYGCNLLELIEFSTKKQLVGIFNISPLRSNSPNNIILNNLYSYWNNEHFSTKKNNLPVPSSILYLLISEASIFHDHLKYKKKGVSY